MPTSDHRAHRIYCAGPLFNPSERAEMEMLAETLEQAEFTTFLPHRDGFLFGGMLPDILQAGYPLDVAQWLARQAIFALDVYQVVIGCAGTVVNLNGRVPDEGAVCEGAIAWTVGKAVVLFKDDTRSLIDGLDNPLVAGLGAFRLVRHVDDLPKAMTRALAQQPLDATRIDALPSAVRATLQRGQQIAQTIGTHDQGQITRTIIQLFDDFQGLMTDAGSLRRQQPPGHNR